jgi:hypothetical protein
MIKNSVNNPPEQGAGFIDRKIGGTTYRVAVFFSGNGKESAEDKILRLAKHDAELMREASGQ